MPSARPAEPRPPPPAEPGGRDVAVAGPGLDVRFDDPLGLPGPLAGDVGGHGSAPGPDASPRAAAFAAHPDWTRALSAHLVDPGARVARVSSGPVELVRLPCLALARGRSLRHPAHDHLSLADVDAVSGIDAGTLLGAVDAALAAATGEVGAVPAWRASPVPEDSALVRAVRERTGVPDGPVDAARWALSPARDTARFDLAGGAFAPPGKLRRNLRRLRARLHEGADAEAVMRSHGRDDADALAAAFERFVALETSGWKAGAGGAPGTAIAADPRLLGFYRALLRPRSTGLEPTIVELALDGRTIAAKLGLRTGATLHLLKIAYDESLAACAPGSLLLESLLERAPAVGLSRVSLVTSPAWAARWHPTVRPAWHVVRYADTAGGRVAAVADRARAAVRRHHAKVRTMRSGA